MHAQCMRDSDSYTMKVMQVSALYEIIHAVHTQIIKQIQTHSSDCAHVGCNLCGVA